MKNSKSFLLLLLISALSSETRVPSQTGKLLECGRELYRGFDSRLQATAIGLAPPSDPAIALAVLQGKPLLAYEHRLVLFESASSPSVLPVPQAVRGVLSDGNSLRLVTQAGLFALGDHDFTKVHLGKWDANATLSQQDTKSTLLARELAANVEFTALTPGGIPVPMFAVNGRLRHMSWTAAGFAAIIGDNLYTFADGASGLESTLEDRSFGSAVDLCVVGPARAVVVFPHTTVLYAHGTRTILAQVTGRCAWSGRLLYLFDQRRGGLWKIDGLDRVGEAASTKAFLASLANAAHAKNPDGDRAFRELARFIGFDNASAQTSRPNPCVLTPLVGTAERP